MEQTQNNNSLLESQRTKILIFALIIFVIGGSTIGLIYWRVIQNRIYIEKAQIVAPQINLAAQAAGTLEEIFVQEGSQVQANNPVARVGNELIKAKVAGTIISVKKDFGKIFNPGETVVSMIDPTELRVIGQIEEDKGLKDIMVGQQAIFEIDTFGSKDYYGVVDEVSATSRENDVVFNISDKRQLNEFNIKIRFDVNLYPELKNGMSAKIWVYKN